MPGYQKPALANASKATPFGRHVFPIRPSRCRVEARRPPEENTYAAAGVDRGATAVALGRLLSAVKYRPPPSHGRPLRYPGHYAGLIRVGRETIAVTTDTVGTKVLLAAQLGSWEEVGEDMVAINSNDLASVGARPFGFVDTVSCAAPDPAVFEAIGRGMDRGLRAAGCALLGGETAIVPAIVQGIDLGGTALGFYPPGRKPVTGESIRPGDTVLGIPSSGLHANGFTLVRRLLKSANVNLAQSHSAALPLVGTELLRPTRTYVAVSEALAGLGGVRGFAHISGGGVRNLLRLSRRVGFHLDEWPDPPRLFQWIRSLGVPSEKEMFQTFNMGIGFVVILAPTSVTVAMRRLAKAGVHDALRIGRTERGIGVRVPRWDLTYQQYA